MNRVKTLLNFLECLPLDTRTLDLLEGTVKLGSSALLDTLEQKLFDYQANESSKSLEWIVYNTHFHWNNTTPLHIQKFRQNYHDLREHWPYERHRDLLSMSAPKRVSIRYMWNDNNKKVLSSMRFERNPWCRNDPLEQLNAFNVNKILNYRALEEEKNRGSTLSTLPKISQLELTLLFHEIFQHYMFLKRNPKLCKYGKKLPIPIVEIPMKPLGQDIPLVRIRNLFKRKAAATWKLLAEENPVLSLENEALLLDIIASPHHSTNVSDRKIKRLYQRACKHSYVICEDRSIGLDFQISKLLKNIS